MENTPIRSLSAAACVLFSSCYSSLVGLDELNLQLHEVGEEGERAAFVRRRSEEPGGEAILNVESLAPAHQTYGQKSE